MKNNMLITNVLPLDNKRRKVYIDGKYAFPLYLSEIRKFNIIENAEVSEVVFEEIEKLLFRRIRERALYLLEAMPRTESNIRRKLFDNHYTEAYINAVIEDLKEYGYIDDVNYAYNYAVSMSENRGMSKRAIIQKLYEKGVDRDIIMNAVNELPEDETELMDRALKKKGLKLSDIDSLEPKEKQRIYRYLQSKGFSVFGINMY